MEWNKFISLYTNHPEKASHHVSIKIEKNEMGGACGAYGGGERGAQGFGGETWGKETTGET